MRCSIKILMFGRGVIATVYGWALEQAGHDVEFYVRPRVLRPNKSVSPCGRISVTHTVIFLGSVMSGSLGPGGTPPDWAVGIYTSGGGVAHGLVGASDSRPPMSASVASAV